MTIFYQSFLLRIWQSDKADPNCWQASLENPQTHVVVNFPNPEALFDFLQSSVDSSTNNTELE